MKVLGKFDPNTAWGRSPTKKPRPPLRKLDELVEELGVSKKVLQSAMEYDDIRGHPRPEPSVNNCNNGVGKFYRVSYYEPREFKRWWATRLG